MRRNPDGLKHADIRRPWTFVLRDESENGLVQDWQMFPREFSVNVAIVISFVWCGVVWCGVVWCGVQHYQMA